MYELLFAGMIFCAIEALRSTRLLISAIWLAGASALLAIGLYLLGGVQVAVMELSIGAGLVTVLFVFAIDIAGDEEISTHPLVPKFVAGGLVIVSLLLLTWLNLPLVGVKIPAPLPAADQATFSTVLWQQRGLDVLVQIVLIFAGALGALGLLTDVRPKRVGLRPEQPAQTQIPTREARV